MPPPAAEVGISPISNNVWRVVGRCVDGKQVDEGSSVTPLVENALETNSSKSKPTKEPIRRPQQRRTKAP